MPLDSIADLERRIRRLEMELDQYKHKFVAPDRTVKTELPSIPLGKWTSFTPAYKGWVADSVTGIFKYSVIGNIVFLLIDMTAGTSNNTDAMISLPINADLNASYGGALGMAMDNGNVLTGAARWYIGGANQEIVFCSDMGSGLWTASGKKWVRCLAIYAKGT